MQSAVMDTGHAPSDELKGRDGTYLRIVTSHLPWVSAVPWSYRVKSARCGKEWQGRGAGVHSWEKIHRGSSTGLRLKI